MFFSRIANSFKEMVAYYRRHKFSVVVIPEITSAKVKPRTLSFNKVVFFLFIYSLLFTVVLSGLIILTPLKGIVFSQEVRLDSESNERIVQLNEKVNRLLTDVERLRSVNRNLRNAIILADTTFEDSLRFHIPEPDGAQGRDSLAPLSGSITQIVLYAMKKFQQEQPSFIRPLSGFVTQQFKPGDGHFGIDYAAEEGTPVLAAANGYVVFADYTIDFGFTLILSHPDNYITVYKHCSALMKNERERVRQGEVVALCGNTGEETTGSHLHFEIWKEGEAVNPESLLLQQ